MKNRYLFLGFLVVSFFIKAQEVTIYCIGDSTMADKINSTENPEHGWAQVLPSFFNEKVKIDNRAVNGRSSKSFIDEGRWDSVLKVLAPNDYVFIQFGHNDQKFKDASRYTNAYTGYRKNLERYVNEARNLGAVPVLFSPIVRRNFNEYGVLIDTHGQYLLVVQLVAAQLDVPFIDLNYLTEALETTYGVEESKTLHLHFQPGENEYYPKGKNDNTHLSKKGALKVAHLAILEIKTLNLALVNYILPL